MSTWLSETAASSGNGATPKAAATLTKVADPSSVDRRLRKIDRALAAVGLTLLAVPYLCARRLGQLHRTPVTGLDGQPFDRLSLRLPETRSGRVLGAFGAADWPVLFNILRGEMAWVGPAPGPRAADAFDPRHRVRPGVVSLWDIRRRVAVDFGSEQEATLEYLSLRGVRHDLGVLARGAFVRLLAPPRVAAAGRVRICDVEFDNVDMAQAVERVEHMLNGSAACQVSFVNPACVNIAAGHRGYRRSLARATLLLPDGIGTKIAGDLLGTPLKQNVNGTDLFPRLCDLLQARGARLFLLGGQPGVPERVASVIAERWPAISIVGARHGFFTASEEGAVADEVMQSHADILLVARGVPSQDVFIDRYLHHFGVKVAMGVGGLFDFVAGRISRAPRWMRDSGLEWVWRLLQEPRRMWKRYLLGNFTFLARVMLQRLRLRHAADDTVPGSNAALRSATTDDAIVAVLFATETAAADLPVERDFPAGLLPFGPTTFVERAVAQLAQEGVRCIHIVACVRPDLLHQVLGEGERWGVQLTWHLAKDPRSAPRALRHLKLRHGQRVVIGNAHLAITAATVRQLVASDLVVDRLDGSQGPQWMGWASVAARTLALLAECEDTSAFAPVWRRHGITRTLVAAAECASAQSAAELLIAQVRARDVDFDVMRGLTQAWIQMPWGAMSAQARVDPGARISGPAWVGPGCLVEAGADIGADVVLTRDVLVSGGTTLRNAVVLPGTFIGRNLEMVGSIANASSVQNVRLGVRTTLDATEGLLTSLHADAGDHVRWLARAAAVLTVALAAPLAGIHALLLRLRGEPLPWTRERAVIGCDPQTGALRSGMLHFARPGAVGSSALAASFGPLLDVAAGRRHWLGVRPRRQNEWYALPADWQSMLRSAPIGWLHAPAWVDRNSCPIEAGAAADLVWLARPRGLAGWRITAAIVSPSRLVRLLRSVPPQGGIA